MGGFYQEILMTKNKYIGKRFDEMLKEEGTLEATELAAIKKVIAEQLAGATKRKKTKSCDPSTGSG
jgi:hypothetical protein